MASPEPRSTRWLAGDGEPALVDRLHALLAQLWDDAPDVGEEDRFLFETALVEVAGNVAEHGARHEHVEVDLGVAAYDDRLVAELRDDGPPTGVDVTAAAMPDDALAEEGRGLALARSAVDELEHRRDGAVNVWRLVRLRTS